MLIGVFEERTWMIVQHCIILYFFFFLDRSFLLRIKLQYGLFSLQSSEDLLSSPISVDWRKNCKFSLSGIRSDQIRSVAQSCPTLCNPMNRSTPGLPVHHQLLEFTHNVDILTHSDFSPHYEMILEINQDPRNLSLLWVVPFISVIFRKRCGLMALSTVPFEFQSSHSCVTWTFC